MSRWACTGVLAMLAWALLGSPAAAAPTGSCPGLTPHVTTFATVGPPLLGWVENLGFDHRGGVWLSTSEGGLIRYDAAEQASTVLSVPSPGASVLGPDGRMYVDFGDGQAAPAAGILSFDPRSSTPVLAPFASGVKMANGLAIDRTGAFYVGDTSANVVQRVRPDGTLDPSFRVAATGADGVAVVGENLYVAELTDAASTVLRVPLNNPSHAAPLARLGDDGLPRIIDDLDVGPDGALYIASTLGLLLRVDTATGAACTLLAGLPPLASARFATGFAPYDGDLFLSSEAGQVLRVHIDGLPAAPAAVAPPAAKTPSKASRGARCRPRKAAARHRRRSCTSVAKRRRRRA